MESKLAIAPEPPSYKIHREKQGWHSVWVIIRNNDFLTVLSNRSLAHTWGYHRQGLQPEVRTSYT